MSSVVEDSFSKFMIAHVTVDKNGNATVMSPPEKLMSAPITFGSY